MLPYEKLPKVAAGEGLRLLDGYTVLDLTSSIAGPYASMLLGDMGARVIKIERPGKGDDSRAWGPPFLDGESLWYLSVNRNKESIALDYSTEKGKEILSEMIKKSDIVLTNLMSNTLTKLEIDYTLIQKINPKIIYVSITGFGLEGKRQHLPCYDLIAEGYSGVMDLTGEADSPPQKIGTPAADLIPGMDAAFATVAALVDRARTGKGHKIEVAMVDSMVRFMSPRIMPYLGSGEVPRRSGAKDSVIAIYQVFNTADHPLTLAIGNDGIWKRFWQAVANPDRGLDERLKTNSARRAARKEIVDEIQEILLCDGRDNWLALFEAFNVPAGPVNNIKNLVEDSCLLDRNVFYQALTEGSSIPQVGLGIRVDAVAETYRHRPPRLGEHTQELLKEWLGYEPEKIAELNKRGIVG